jgi:hypothetical protein
MKLIHKEYAQPFLVEPTKLNRIVGKIHERLADHANSSLHDSFAVFLTGNRREEMTTLDDVLALDNSRKHKVERLVVLCSAATPDAARPEHEVEVDFACPKPTSGGTAKIVALGVRSDAAAWAGRTLSEVEEQVERTWLHHTRHASWLVLLLILLVVLLFFAIMSPFVSFGGGAPRADTWWLSSSDIDRIEAMLKEHPTLTDEELREVSTRQLRNIIGFPRQHTSVQTNEVARALFLVVPLSVVFAGVIVLLKTCYPSAVFLWGDEVDRYSNIVQRRKVVWNIIIGVVVVGVLSKLLYEGLSSWLPRGHA